MTNQLLEMHRSGKIPKNVVMLFGISGSLPEKSKYDSMTKVEKINFWSERLESNLGPEGLILLKDYLPKEVERFTHNWLKEGF